LGAASRSPVEAQSGGVTVTNKMSARVVSRGGLVASFVLALNGCSGSSTTPPSDPSAPRAAATFAKSFGDARNNSAFLAAPTADGGYVFVGGWGGWVETTSLDQFSLHNADELWVNKLDANGDSEWQVLLGEGIESDAADPVTIDSPMHRTADGGFIVGGSIKRRDTGFDFLIRKLNAAGSIEWSRSYDSGAWRDYSYVQGSTTTMGLPESIAASDPAAAHDRVVDLYPAPDGGYWLAGTSYANVHTERDSFESSADDPYSVAGGNTFYGAASVVVLRIDDEGQLLGQHRYTDDQFDRGGGRPIVRPRLDGTALLVRSISATEHRRDSSSRDDDLVLIDRVGANGQSFQRVEVPTQAGRLGPVRALIQTDDPDPVEFGLGPRDGVRDDGFAILWPTELLKLDRELRVEWGGRFEAHRYYDTLEQVCEPGNNGPLCHLFVGGYEYRPGGAPAFSRIELIDTFGDAAGGRTLTTFQTIDAMRIRGGRLHVIGAEQGDPRGGFSVEMDAQLNQIEGTLHPFTRLAPSFESPGMFTASIYDDGGFAYSYYSSDARVPYTPDGTIERRLHFVPQLDTERPRGIVEVAPGSFIVVAGAASFYRETPSKEVGEIWLVRITNGQVDWQHVWTPPGEHEYHVHGVVPSGDGGVVLAVQTLDTHPTDVPAERLNSHVYRLLKINGSGVAVWETPPLAVALGKFETDRLVALADGYAVIGKGVLSRVDAAGNILWESALTDGTGRDEEPTQFVSLAALDDGGFALLSAGSDHGFMRIVRTDNEGAPVWSRGYSLQPFITIRPQVIIQTADGGFLVGADGVLESIPAEMGRPTTTPGQSNLAFIKLDEEGELVWSRLYGGLLAEFLEGMRPTGDGGAIVAAHSHSMGDRREAWILRLGPDGLIAPGCNADLGSFASGPQLEVISALSPQRTLLTPEPRDEKPLPFFAETGVVPERPQVVVARQCFGTANPANPLPPSQQVRLTITQAGDEQGVVTSEPRGILCGTGAGSEFCSATFPVGTRVVLRASQDGGNFRRWLRGCEEESGFGNPLCVLTLTSDQSVSVVFGPADAVFHRVQVAVDGDGLVSGGGLSCRLGGTVEECSREYPAGAEIELVATADENRLFTGWGGDCAQFGTTSPIAVVVARALACSATFVPALDRLIAVSVTGPGTVRDSTGTAINCREGGSSAECEEAYAGTQGVVLTAIPDAGQRFVGWGRDCTQFGTDTSVVLNTVQSQVCSAEFSAPPPPTGAVLTVNLTGGVSTVVVTSQPSGIECRRSGVSDCMEVYPVGTRVLLVAGPPNEFGSWQGCDRVLDINYCEVTVNASREVVATFR
jgi:hypothetical protein